MFKDKVMNKVYHTDLVKVLKILKMEGKFPKFSFYKDLNMFFIKLCNPIRIKLYDLFFKVSSKSLSRDRDASKNRLSPKMQFLGTFY